MDNASGHSVDLQSQEVKLDAGRRDLAGRTFLPGGPGPTGAGVLFIHGWESSQSNYGPRAGRTCAEVGATCLTFDLSGHGESGGHADSFALHDHLADAIVAYDTLAALPGVDSDRIGICGASYGAYLAASLIECRPIKALLLRAPALYPDSALHAPAHARPGPGALRTAIPLQGLATFEGPVLIIESEKDEVIPPEVIGSYLDASHTASHAVLQGAAHALTDQSWDESFVDLLLGWGRSL